MRGRRVVPEQSQHRVAITGLGAISALGQSARHFWDAMMAGRCGIGPLTGVAGGDLGGRVAAQVTGFEPHAHFDERRVPFLDPFAQYALVAAAEAIADAELCITDEISAHTAVVLGSGAGGDTTVNQCASRLYGPHAACPHPLTIPRAMLNAAVSHIAIEHGITGPAFAVSSACASATHAIAQAFALVQSGVVSVAITGGSEACLTYGTIKAWEALRVLAPDTCRPFSRGRRGMVLGEGAGVLVLETLAAAQARGARIYAELAGVGMSADAAEIVQPSIDGTARAMTLALANAHLSPDEVDYVNAHGTGTLLNDKTETEALHRVFGAHARTIAVSSTKSMHGHAMGASGALEAIATVLAIHEGAVPPTANYAGRDADCDLDYTPDAAREMPVEAALSNSFAFGGLNGVLAFRHHA